MNAEQKYDLFLQVEKLYLDYFYSKVSTRRQINMNLCCNEGDGNDIIAMGDNIKNVLKFASLPLRDIYVVLIYIYYSLRYNEPNQRLWLDITFLRNNTINKDLSIELYWDITTGDIMVFQQNLSSAIRKHIQGMNGGRKYRRKSCKKKKYMRKTYRNKRN